MRLLITIMKHVRVGDLGQGERIETSAASFENDDVAMYTSRSAMIGIMSARSDG